MIITLSFVIVYITLIIQLPFQGWASWELDVEDDIMPRHSR